MHLCNKTFYSIFILFSLNLSAYYEININYESVKDLFKDLLSESNDTHEQSTSSQTFDDSESNDDSIEENPFSVKSTPSKNKKSKTPVLDNFGRDLTSYASEGKLDPIIGREKEIERYTNI